MSRRTEKFCMTGSRIILEVLVLVFLSGTKLLTAYSRRNAQRNHADDEGDLDSRAEKLRFEN